MGLHFNDLISDILNCKMIYNELTNYFRHFLTVRVVYPYIHEKEGKGHKGWTIKA